MAQADTIVPGGVQGLDRYAYVNNSPLNYVDSSGHFGQCHDGQSGYQCRMTQTKTWQVASKGKNKPTYAESFRGLCEEFDAEGDCIHSIEWGLITGSNPQENVELIALIYGIHLSPNDYWNFQERLFAPGANPLGWTPRDWTFSGDNEVFNKNGNKLFDDAAVYISGDAFKRCRYNLDCIGGIMAHEAMHSQFEYVIENSPNFHGWHTIENINRLTLLEEIFIDQSVLRSGVFPLDSLIRNRLYLGFNMGECIESYSQMCGYPQTILQSYYGVPLNPNVVFGG
jgi:hypothetical protein